MIFLFSKIYLYTLIKEGEISPSYGQWFLQSGRYATKKEKRFVVSGLEKPLFGR